jgi:transposase-like protein
MAETKYAMNLMKLLDAFDTDAECRAELEKLRWPDGVQCPRCSSDKISRIKERKQFDCDACRYQFSVTAGTIFHDSHLPLAKWFIAIYLMCESKKGISANQMKRTLGVSYKTAWYLCHRIREAMVDLNAEKLTGTIECDETYIGGHRKNVGKGYRGNKHIVLAAIQRGGAVRMRSSLRNNRKSLHGFINETTKNPSRIMTDEWYPYRGVSDADTTHEVVNHRREEWVRGDVHTNTVEGVFSLFKRSIVGSFHQVSGKHLDRYLDEFEFRFNNRKNPYLFRDTLKRLTKGATLPYEKLTA